MKQLIIKPLRWNDDAFALERQCLYGAKPKAYLWLS